MRVIVLALASLFILARAAAAANPPAPALDAIEHALDWIGRPAEVAAIRSISFGGRGHEYREAERQGRSPETNVVAELEQRIAADFESGRIAFETRTGDPTVGRRWRRAICDRSTSISLNLVSRLAERHENPGTDLRAYERRIPLAMLLEARANSDRLSADGADVVYSPEGAAPIRLRFDRNDARLSSIESLVDFPDEGEVPVTFEYLGRIVAEPGLAFPAGHRKRIAGRLFEEVEYSDLKVNAVSSLFDIPEDLRAQADPPGTVRALAPGVYMVENLSSYNLLFVVFKEFIVALEAPAPYPGLNVVPARIGSGSRDICEAYLKKIREAVPGKPVRYFAVTHHHSDHAGGARVFFESGATLLTTPGNRRYFESVAPGGRIETISDRRILSDGVQELQLLNVGLNPHTDEMIAAYLPKADIVYQSDLFFSDDRRVGPERHYPPVMHFFAEWLKRERIVPSKIFGFHTAGFQTMDDVNDVLASQEKQESR